MIIRYWSLTQRQQVNLTSPLVAVLLTVVVWTQSVFAQADTPASTFAQRDQELKEMMQQPEVSKAMSLITTGKWQEAEPLLNQSLRKFGADSPQALAIYNARGTMYFLGKNFEQALSDSNRVMAILNVKARDYPTLAKYPNVSAVLNTCLNMRFTACLLTERYAEALAADKQLLEWKPETDSAGRRIFQGMLSILAEEYSGALSEFERAESLDPSSKSEAEAGKELTKTIQSATDSERNKLREETARTLRARFTGVSTGVMTTMHNKARDAEYKANMRRLQIAVETYATDHAGMYPTIIDQQFEQYARKEASLRELWPLKDLETGKPITPVTGSIKSVNASRAAIPDALVAGAIEYTCLKGGTSYAIRGGGHDGKALPGTNGAKTLVLSNE